MLSTNQIHCYLQVVTKHNNQMPCYIYCQPIGRHVTQMHFCSQVCNIIQSEFRNLKLHMNNGYVSLCLNVENMSKTNLEHKYDCITVFCKSVCSCFFRLECLLTLCCPDALKMATL